MKFSGIMFLGIMLVMIFMAVSVIGKPRTYLVEAVDDTDQSVRNTILINLIISADFMFILFHIINCINSYVPLCSKLLHCCSQFERFVPIYGRRGNIYIKTSNKSCEQTEHKMK